MIEGPISSPVSPVALTERELLTFNVDKWDLWLHRGLSLWCRWSKLSDRVAAFEPLTISDMERGPETLAEKLNFVQGNSRLAFMVALGRRIDGANLERGEAAFLLRLVRQTGCFNFSQSIRGLLSDRTVPTDDEAKEFAPALVSALGKHSGSTHDLFQAGQLLLERGMLAWSPAVQLVTHIAAREPEQIDEAGTKLAPFLFKENANFDSFLLRQLMDRLGEEGVWACIKAFPDSRLWGKLADILSTETVIIGAKTPVTQANKGKWKALAAKFVTNTISGILGEPEERLAEEAP